MAKHKEFDRVLHKGFRQQAYWLRKAVGLSTIHRWNPWHTKYKAARKKWTKKCPICEMLRALRAEAVRALPLRR